MSQCTLYLEQHVVLPLEELYHRLKYRIDMIQHVYTSQVCILQGSGSSSQGAVSHVQDQQEKQVVALLSRKNKTAEDMKM